MRTKEAIVTRSCGETMPAYRSSSSAFLQHIVCGIDQKNVACCYIDDVFFSPHKNGQSSLFSGKSGFKIRTPGTTPPAMKEKSARLFPYAISFETVPNAETKEMSEPG
jgi:hypothetical protein